MIYAVDFDGTLCYSNWPELGEPNLKLINFLKEKKEQGDKLILWTMREGETLDKAVDWCSSYGLTFDTINDNLEERNLIFNCNPRKVYADYYIDDHNMIFDKEEK